MMMSCWHLIRNKTLFVSCAIFVTFAFGVHLMPYYFPSISEFKLRQPTEVIPSQTSDSCVSFLHSVMYSAIKECNSHPSFDNNNNNCTTGCEKPWERIKSGRVAECGFHKLQKSDAADLLNGSWVVIAGDSEARLIAISLIELLRGINDRVGSIVVELYKTRSVYSITVEEIDMKLDFVWAPFVRNLTDLVTELNLNTSKNLPDVLVMGAGLWDMLHMNNASMYGASLSVLRDNALALLPVSSNLNFHLFWVGMPTLITAKLKTEEKREKMNGEMYNSYDYELTRSKISRRLGGPFLELELRVLSELFGARCTSDGMHYDTVVYDAAVQIMLNALIVESNQKLE